MSESKWLKFILVNDTGKTVIIDVESKKSGELLGYINWFSHWRQYAFFPSSGMVFNQECMSDIIQKLKELMDERKK